MDALINEIKQVYAQLANGRPSAFACNKENLEDLLLEANLLYPNEPKIQKLIKEMKDAIDRLDSTPVDSVKTIKKENSTNTKADNPKKSREAWAKSSHSLIEAMGISRDDFVNVDSDSRIRLDEKIVFGNDNDEEPKPLRKGNAKKNVEKTDMSDSSNSVIGTVSDLEESCIFISFTINGYDEDEGEETTRSCAFPYVFKDGNVYVIFDDWEDPSDPGDTIFNDLDEDGAEEIESDVLAEDFIDRLAVGKAEEEDEELEGGEVADNEYTATVYKQGKVIFKKVYTIINGSIRNSRILKSFSSAKAVPMDMPEMPKAAPVVPPLPSTPPPMPSSASTVPPLPKTESVEQTQKEDKGLNDLVMELNKMLSTIELDGIENLERNKTAADRLLGKAQALYPDNEQVAAITAEIETLLKELALESKAAKLAAEKEAARQAEEAERAQRAKAKKDEQDRLRIYQLEQEAREAKEAAKKQKMILFGGLFLGLVVLYLLFGGSSDKSSSTEPVSKHKRELVKEAEISSEIDDVPDEEPAPEMDSAPEMDPVPDEPESTLSYGAVSDDMFEYLSKEKLTDADLKGKTKDVLRVMRNAIFARHGYIFQSQDLTDFFERFSWYEPKTRNVNNQLNKVELHNIDMIKKYEK